jgi:hypothetical protein
LAFNWLRYEHGCSLISFERTPLETDGRPDVLGMLRNRQLVEVEIKVDLADMRHDASKRHRRMVIQDIQRPAPGTANYLYYLVPEEMVGPALEELPAHVGVISPNHAVRHGHTGMPTIALHRRAVQLHERRLSIREALTLSSQMSASMCSLVVELALVRLKQDLNVEFEPIIEVSTKLPASFSMTRPEAVFDQGDRTGRVLGSHSLDAKWRDARAVDKSTPKVVSDIVRVRRAL